MSNAKNRPLFEYLEANNMLHYGSLIPAAVVRSVLGLNYPDQAPKKVFDQLALAELAAIDYVRNILLARGMYITGNGSDGYRILTPAENAQQCDVYISSADKKLRRALKLSRNTPKMADHKPDQREARIVMKRESLRRQF